MIAVAPRWARAWLIAAAVYNLAWGGFIVLWPAALFDWSGMAPPRYMAIWQCVGMIVGVYGVGYGIAATDPLRHWPIVLVGLLGKVFGPIGFLQAASTGELPWRFGWTILTNDLFWWPAFAAILWLVWGAEQKSGADASACRASPNTPRSINSIQSDRR